MTDNRARFRIASIAVSCALLVGVLATPAAAVTPSAFLAQRVANQDIVQRLERLGNFSVLLAALDAAQLKDTVASGGSFTLFAPTDQAFADLLAQLNVTPEQLLADPNLAKILLYHVASGALRSGALLRASTQPTLSDGQPVLVVLEGLRVKVNQANVTRANVAAKNGIIHVLDRVLLPPTEPVTIGSMLDVLALDGRFSTLLAALEVTGLDSALSGTDPLTLFAPTDEAFGELLAQLGIGAEELLNDPNLPNILLYHVVGGRNGALELLVKRTVDTLQGDPVTLRLRPGGLFVNDSKLINPNVNAPNGFIHTIDKVLLP